ncbi:PAS domain-containing protein [bacterium]|nr:PAS domain-containing protein [bacterium]
MQTHKETSDLTSLLFRRVLIRLLIITIGVAVLYALLVHQFVRTSNEEVTQHQRNDVRMVTEIASGSVQPVVEDYQAGRISDREALEQVIEIVNQMTYEDNYGANYVFLIGYDGMLYVQPFFPARAMTDQWNMQDENGKYLIRELIQVARNNPEGGFVRYLYRNPATHKVENKLSYAMSIPELDLVVGTGIYTQQAHLAYRRLTTAAYVAGFGAILLIMLPVGISLHALQQRNRDLETVLRDRERAEKALRISENRLSGVLKHMPLGVLQYEVREDDTILLRGSNPAASSILGHDLKEKKGLTMEEAFPGVENTYIPEKYRMIARQGGAFQEEISDPSNPDAPRVFRVFLFQTEPNHLSVLFRDITEQKRIERERANHRQLLQTVLDVYPHVTFAKDLEGRFRIVNKALQDYFGLPADKILGAREKDLLKDPEVVVELEEEDRLVIENHAAIFNREWEIRDPHGRLRSYLGSKIPIHLPDTDEVLALAVFVEITELKEAIHHRDEARLLYETVLNTAGDAILTADADGRILNTNQASEVMFQLDEGGLAGQNLTSLFAEQAAEAILAEWIRQLEAGETSIVAELNCSRKAEEVFPAEVSMTRWILNGKIHFTVIVRDITRRREAEETARLQQEQLIQADKMIALGTLVSGVAHEVNNPNNYIALNASLLEESWRSVLPILDQHLESEGDFSVGGLPYTEMRDRLFELIQAIGNGSKRIESIVFDLKNFARQGSPGEIENVRIDEVIRSAVALNQNLIAKSTRRFSVSYSEARPSVRGHRQRLEQVVINLLQNACQAIDCPDQKLHIRCTQEQRDGVRFVCVCVEDGGRGMGPEVQNRLFDPFFTTRRNDGGTGLGLAVSNSIMQEHGGRLEFDSVVGEGTQMRMLLPVVTTETTPTTGIQVILSGESS